MQLRNPILLILLFLFICQLLKKKSVEKYSQGALLQLVAKGPQDSYLIGGSRSHQKQYLTSAAQVFRKMNSLSLAYNLNKCRS